MIQQQVQCELCSHKMRSWLHLRGDYRRPGAAQEFDLYWCPQDNFGKVFPRPTHAEIQEFYDITAYYTHGKICEQKVDFCKWEMGKRLRHHIAWRLDYGNQFGFDHLKKLVTRGALSILDVGCGDGRRLKDATTAGFASAIGIEPDRAARQIASSEGLLVYDGTAEVCPEPLIESRFDVILFMHVLEHTLDPVKALRTLGDLLNPSGVLIVETPNNLAIGCGIAGSRWPWLDVPRHLNFFASKSLQRILQISGFAVIDVNYFGYCRQFSKQWLDTEQTISRFLARNENAPSRLDALKMEGYAWANLICGTMVPPHMKYDSVRMVARKRIP